MKRILITGSNSYIGASVENWLIQWPHQYCITTIDMQEVAWTDNDFSSYDVAFHVAGIAHSDSGKLSPEDEKLYRTVNTDLAIAAALKAKLSGVNQFIFMSSMIVYGDGAPIGQIKMIKRDSQPIPSNFYGDSKFQAEKGILALESPTFRVVILRPPMIYGPGCKGNYPLLAKIAKTFPIFPNITNVRSMLFIENFNQFLKLMIDNNESGIFWPQNSDYSNTSKMVQMIAEANGRKIVLTRVLNWGVYLMKPLTRLVDKAFGNFFYDMNMSRYKENYQIVGLRESVWKTERFFNEDNLDH